MHTRSVICLKVLKSHVYNNIINITKIIIYYLRKRHQFVAFKNINSDLQEIQIRIPQGSILGPLFFSIYINDLINSSNIFNYLMYADE